jgi:hypothetical protein
MAVDILHVFSELRPDLTSSDQALVVEKIGMAPRHSEEYFITMNHRRTIWGLDHDPQRRCMYSSRLASRLQCKKT